MANRLLATKLVTLLFTATPAIAASAASYTFTTVDFPNATFTSVIGINARGTIVGAECSQSCSGFVGTPGNLTVLNFPGALTTAALSINKSGDIVGYYDTKNAGPLPFYYSSNSFNALPLPTATTSNAIANSINDSGNIAGQYADSTNQGNTQGFLLSSGQYTILDFPGSIDSGLKGINNAGAMVGFYTIDDSGDTFSSVDKNSKFRQLKTPDCADSAAFAINSAGTIVGECDQNGVSHGYISQGGSISLIDVPGSSGTNALGINSQGLIVGSYDAVGAKGNVETHGFIATPNSEYR